MSIHTIQFISNLEGSSRIPFKRCDIQLTVVYDYYHGNGLFSDDPSQVSIIKAFDDQGKELSDAQIEEIRLTAEHAIITQLGI